MKQLVKIYQKYNNFFHINWFITNKCNFSCEYCHPFNYANTSPKFDINVYKNFIHRILNQIGNKQLIISFTGGEPTSLDWFDEFLDFLIENNVKIGLTSNGSKSIKWWKKYRKAFDWVSLSFHAEKLNLKTERDWFHHQMCFQRRTVLLFVLLQLLYHGNSHKRKRNDLIYHKYQPPVVRRRTSQ